MTPAHFLDPTFFDAEFYGIVTNGSDETIDRCRARCMVNFYIGGKPAPFPSVSAVTSVGRVLPGQDGAARHGFDLPPEWPRPYRAMQVAMEPLIELLFTDAAGIRWQRDTEHTLIEVVGPDPW